MPSGVTTVNVLVNGSSPNGSSAAGPARRCERRTSIVRGHARARPGRRDTDDRAQIPARRAVSVAATSRRSRRTPAARPSLPNRVTIS
jgi:hypothetical protein